MAPSPGPQRVSASPGKTATATVASSGEKLTLDAPIRGGVSVLPPPFSPASVCRCVHAPALWPPVVSVPPPSVPILQLSQCLRLWSGLRAAPACSPPPDRCSFPRRERLFRSGQKWNWESLLRNSSRVRSPCSQLRQRLCLCLFTPRDGRCPVLTQEVGSGTRCPHLLLFCFRNTFAMSYP